MAAKEGRKGGGDKGKIRIFVKLYVSLFLLKEIMHQNALEDAYEFVEKRGLSKDDFVYHMMFDDEDDPGERAYECATEHNADMIILSSRGRTGLASILLGSVAEKMVLYDSSLPLLIIKNKSENLGFFDALMRI